MKCCKKYAKSIGITLLLVALLALALHFGGAFSTIGSEYFRPSIEIRGGRLIADYTTEQIGGLVRSDAACHTLAGTTLKFSNPQESQSYCDANYPSSMSHVNECWLSAFDVLDATKYTIDTRFCFKNELLVEKCAEGYMDGSRVCVGNDVLRGLVGANSSDDRFSGYFKIHSESKTATSAPSMPPTGAATEEQEAAAQPSQLGEWWSSFIAWLTGIFTI